MWELRVEEGKQPRTYTLVPGTVTLGRGVACEIRCELPSVSKAHLVLTVTAGDGHDRLFIRSIGRLGVHLNGVLVGNDGRDHEVPDGAKIMLLSPGVEKAELIDLKKLAATVLGASFSDVWTRNATHLIVGRTDSTPKLVSALLSDVRIVTPGFLRAAASRVCVDVCVPLPHAGDFTPPLPTRTGATEHDAATFAQLWENADLRYLPERRRLLEGYTFVFSTHNYMSEIIEQAIQGSSTGGSEAPPCVLCLSASGRPSSDATAVIDTHARTWQAATDAGRTPGVIVLGCAGESWTDLKGVVARLRGLGFVRLSESNIVAALLSARSLEIAISGRRSMEASEAATAPPPRGAALSTMHTASAVPVHVAASSKSPADARAVSSAQSTLKTAEAATSRTAVAAVPDFPPPPAARPPPALDMSVSTTPAATTLASRAPPPLGPAQAVPTKRPDTDRSEAREPAAPAEPRQAVDPGDEAARAPAQSSGLSSHALLAAGLPPGAPTGRDSSLRAKNDTAGDGPPGDAPIVYNVVRVPAGSWVRKKVRRLEQNADDMIAEPVTVDAAVNSNDAEAQSYFDAGMRAAAQLHAVRAFAAVSSNAVVPPGLRDYYAPPPVGGESAEMVARSRASGKVFRKVAPACYVSPLQVELLEGEVPFIRDATVADDFAQQVRRRRREEREDDALLDVAAGPRGGKSRAGAVQDIEHTLALVDQQERTIHGAARQRLDSESMPPPQSVASMRPSALAPGALADMDAMRRQAQLATRVIEPSSRTSMSVARRVPERPPAAVASTAVRAPDPPPPSNTSSTLPLGAGLIGLHALTAPGASASTLLLAPPAKPRTMSVARRR